MESAKIGHPVHQLLRHAYLGTDPNALPASTVGQRRPANRIQGTGDTPLHAVSGPDAVPGFRSSTGSSDRPEQENNARPPAMSLEPRGPLARTLILLFFMSIVFLTGIFIGASLIPTPQGRTRPADISISVPVLPLIETPTPGPATTGSDSSSQAAIPQAGPTAVTSAESTLPQSTSAAARPEAVSVSVEPVSAPTPQSQPPSVTAGAPPAPAEPLTAPPMLTKTVGSTPSPIAPAQAPATIPTEPDLSEIQRQVLLSRGDALFSAGDVTAARLFYQRGADAGDGTAALRLGETFDAAFLERARLGRVPGDLEKAASWYRQARALGNAEAEILLQSLPGQ